MIHPAVIASRVPKSFCHENGSWRITIPRINTQTKRSFNSVLTTEASMKFDDQNSSKLLPTISSPTKAASSQICKLVGIFGAASMNGKQIIVPVRL